MPGDETQNTGRDLIMKRTQKAEQTKNKTTINHGGRGGNLQRKEE